jgi:ribosome-associated protein
MVRISTPHIDPRELAFEFIRASGPGGQNVNKVATAVQLRFDILHSPSLADEAKIRLIQIAGQRVNATGILIIEAKRFRSQEQNRQDAADRFNELIKQAASKPKPRKKTKPSQASKEKRLEVKRQRANVKQLRQKKNFE